MNTLKAIGWGLLYWLMPDFRHPLREALRRAGIETVPVKTPARW